MPFYQERIEFIPTANPDLVFCEYGKLRISFMVREGGRDENGQSLGPVKVVSISGKGYGSMLPTPDEIKGILNLFGLDVQRSRRNILPHKKGSRYGDILCYEQPLFLMPAQNEGRCTEKRIAGTVGAPRRGVLRARRQTKCGCRLDAFLFFFIAGEHIFRTRVLPDESQENPNGVRIKTEK